MIHEHQSSLGTPIIWNTGPGGVYDGALKLAGWDKSMTDKQIVERYDKTELNGSSYDPTSIMHYWYPEAWLDKKEYERRGLEMPKLDYNTKLSRLDKIWLSKYYRKEPFPEDASEEMIDSILKGIPVTPVPPPVTPVTPVSPTEPNIVDTTVPSIDSVTSLREANEVLKKEKQKLVNEETRLIQEAIRIQEEENKINEQKQQIAAQASQLQTKEQELASKANEISSLKRKLELEETQRKQQEQKTRREMLQKKKEAEKGFILPSYHQDTMAMLLMGTLVCGLIYYKSESLYKK
jgi:DNA repair exonuclease SbcCD ATPase subunit